jgi:UDP-glucose 4-epimerase
MRVLITGIAGFIGSNLAKALLAEGHEVVGIDNFVTGRPENINDIKGDIELHEFDLAKRGFATSFAGEDVTKDIERCDVVFHCCAIPRVPISFEEPAKIMNNNVSSLLWALEACRKWQARMVYSSSSSVYGEGHVHPLREEYDRRPQSPYAVSKSIGEDLCKNYEEAFNVKYVALRYFNVYGPGMTPGGYATAIKIWLEQLRKNEPLTITGDGEQERDFTHVEDVVKANMKAMIQGSGVYNIGRGRPLKINYVANLISKNHVHIDPRIEPKKTHALTRKAKMELQWEPKIDIEDAIPKLLTKNL